MLNLNLILDLEQDQSTAKWRQLYSAIKQAILSEQLKKADRLPSSRSISVQLKISRNTVTTALDQLIAEGFLETKAGSGTYVADLEVELKTLPNIAKENAPIGKRQLSHRGNEICHNMRQSSLSERKLKPFQSGLPDLSLFPKLEFSKLIANAVKISSYDQLDYDYEAGLPEFKQEIANYLNQSRGVKCGAEQVIILSGSQAALDLIARMMLDEKDEIWFEQPGYGGAYSAFKSAGAKINALKFSSLEHNFHEILKQCPNPKLCYVTPSHQHPTGITMKLKTRQTLIELAQSQQFWVIEDDYDSEYRYDGKPIAALQGLDPYNRCFYIGTFSKILSPALRCAYLIVPKDFTKKFQTATFNTGLNVPSAIQIALTQFMQSGQFKSHIRKCSKLYDQRRQFLISQIIKHLSDHFTLMEHQAGMHFSVALRSQKLKNIGDKKLAELFNQNQIMTRSISQYSESELSAEDQGLILGFAAFKEQEIEKAIIQMKNLIEAL